MALTHLDVLRVVPSPFGFAKYVHYLDNMLFCIYLNLFYTILTMNVYVIDLNACMSSPCENDGSCINTAHGFECKCKGNFKGLTCTRRYYSNMFCNFHRKLRDCSCILCTDSSYIST